MTKSHGPYISRIGRALRLGSALAALVALGALVFPWYETRAGNPFVPGDCAGARTVHGWEAGSRVRRRPTAARTDQPR
jgi:hypothetical protein